MLRNTAKLVWSGLVVATIVAAFVLSLTRLLLPLLAEYRADIEGWVGGVVGQPVEIGEIDAHFRGLYPALHLRDVTLLDSNGGERLAAFKELSVELDWWRSLLHRQLEPGTFRVAGVELLVEADKSGKIRIAGFGGGNRGGPNIGRWVLDRKRLAIEGATVTWRNAATPSPPLTFTNATILLANDDGRHQVTAEVTLPPDMGSTLRVTVDIAGDPLADRGWSGQGYINVADAHLARWWQPPQTLAFAVERGTVSVEGWIEWRDGRVYSGQGEITANELRIAAAASEDVPPFELNSFYAQARWQRDREGWKLLAAPLRWATPLAQPVDTQLGIEQRPGEEGEKQLHIALLRADLKDLLALGQLAGSVPNSALSWLKELQPTAQLENLYLRLQPQEQATRYFVHAAAKELGWRAARKIPGVEKLALTLQADNDLAVVQFDSRSVRFDFAGLFREPLPIDLLAGTVVARRNAHGWTLRGDDIAFANGDGQGAFSVGLEPGEEGKAPVLDLTARIWDWRGEAMPRYLPRGIMSPKLAEWLDRAIPAGRVTLGGLVLRGPVSEFPFAEGDGRFNATLDITGGVLAFAPNWPVIDRVNAQVVFHEQGVEVRGGEGVTLGNQLANVQVNLPRVKFAERIIKIKGEVRGPFAEGLRYLNESPLQRSIGRHFVNARAQGDHRTNLSLLIPLAAGAKDVQVRGDVNFVHNSLDLSGDGMVLSNLRGRLGFTHDSVSATGLEAEVLGQPAVFDVRSEPNEAGRGLRAIVIEAHGSAQAAALQRRLGLQFLSMLDGPFQWRGMMQISVGQEGGARLELQSDLVGAALTAPLGLGKRTEEPRPFRLAMPVPLAAGSVLEASLGSDLHGIFELGRKEGKLYATRGELRFGGVRARMPSAPGLRIAGFLPQLDTSDLPPPRRSELEHGEAESADSTGTPFSAVDVSIGQARILGRDFSRVIVEGSNREGGWSLNVTSENLAGSLWIPRDPGAAIRADFDRLVLQAPTGVAAGSVNDGERTDPRRLPPTVLTAKQFEYGDVARGSLEATLLGTPRGLRLASARLVNGPTRLIATGDWTVTEGGHETALDLVMETDNAGTTLADFGYAEALSSGVGFHTAYVTWPGAPTEYASQRLSGTATVNIRQGRILDVEPGAGRIFGLLSFQALPRRLNLDFSDFFREGFAFDAISGEFVIRDGVATTDNLTVKGPAAEIRVQGQVNLAERTYNEQVTVMPNVTGAVPWAAVGVGVTNPAAGAAVWLAERLLRKPVSDLTQAKYRVTGSWNNPTVEKLARSEGRAKEAEEVGVNP